MKRPHFEPIEKKSPSNILLLDKEGLITKGLLPLLPKSMNIIVVSTQKPEIVSDISVEYIHFGSYGMPSIPDIPYSHILVVSNGEKDILTLIPQFLEKARTDSAKIFFIVDLFFADPSFLSELTYSYRNAHVIVTGDFFGKDKETDTTIQRFFDEANTKGTIQVSGDGLTQTFPVYFPDAIEEISRVVFLAKASKISYVFPKHAPTQISLARMFQSINPFLRIDFVDEKIHGSEVFANSQKTMHVTSGGTYVLQNNYPLLKKIKEPGLLSEESVKQNSNEKSEVKKITRLRHLSRLGLTKAEGLVGQSKTKKPSSLFSFFFFVILLFCLPFLITVLFAGLGIGGFLLTKQSLVHGDFTTAGKTAHISQVFFGVAQATDTIVSLQAEMVGMGAQGEKLEQFLSLGAEGSYALINAISATQTVLSIANKQSLYPKEEFLLASNKLKKAVTIFQKIRAQDDFSLPVIAELDPLIRLVGATIDSYPTLLGMDGGKTYLLLFQNNAELRPSGGFIGSYGLVTLDRGSIADFQIHDVYDADGQLKGHVEPAYPFRRYMGIVHQYMRDSNYDADFPTAASASANMLAMETGTVVSGVIAIDTSLVETLVELLQPIYVPDYKETVTAKNFYMLTQSHAEKNFFPGSTQKKDFLRSLFAALQLKLTDQKHLPYFVLAKAIAKGISEKHILFAFPDVGLQQLFSANDLSASMKDTRETKKNQYNDFLGINEANIGANKANAFVYRKVDQHLTVDEAGRIKNTVTIRYKNESKDWPGGDYKNYLRIITPVGSRLSDITIDGQKQIIFPATTDYLLYERPDFTPPQGLEVETTEELSKALFGFLVIVPKGTFKTITISYVSPTTLDMGQQVMSYNLWYFKQPGTNAYDYSFAFFYPDSMKAFKFSKELKSVGGSVIFENVIMTNQHLSIDLSKK